MIALGGWPHVEVRSDGVAYVEGSRVRVVRLWKHHRNGVPVEKILRFYPKLGTASVYAALAYAYEHEDEMHGTLAMDRAEANAS